MPSAYPAHYQCQPKDQLIINLHMLNANVKLLGELANQFLNPVRGQLEPDMTGNYFS